MANITNVDYEAIPYQAQQMRNLGQALNKEILTAYQSIANMHNSWYGKRYNELVKSFNEMIPKINPLLELVVGDIPFALETIANNYSQADQGRNVVAAAKTAPSKIPELTVSTAVGMKFVTNEVENTRTSVSTNFKNSESKMNDIATEYKKIQWKSEAADAFFSKFSKLQADIVAAFQNIDTKFTSLMSHALNDIQSTENANTVQ